MDKDRQIELRRRVLDSIRDDLPVMPEGGEELRHLMVRDHPLPSWLLSLKSLEWLAIEDCGIERHLPEICRLPNLQSLGISDDDCPDLAPLLQLKKLKDLALSVNCEHMPEVIGELKGLETVTFNYFDVLHQEMFEVLSKLPKLKTLRMHCCYDGNCEVANYLSEDIAMLADLEELDLHDWWGFKWLPDSVGAMKKLRSLSVTNYDWSVGGDIDGLMSLPESIGDLPLLESLSLHGKYLIKELPDSVRRLSNLRRLDITGIEFSDNPFSEKQWANLEELTISAYGKTAETIVESLPEMKKLKRLIIYGAKGDEADLSRFPELNYARFGSEIVRDRFGEEKHRWDIEYAKEKWKFLLPD